MDNYSLNGVDLRSYGIIPGMAPNSNIALAGAWNMPARDGETFFVWPDENGIEPYLNENEIFFVGRNLSYHFLVETNSKAEALESCYALYEAIDGFDELVPFASDDFGSWDVRVSDVIRVEWLQHGWCKGVLPMREPVVNLEGSIPGSDGGSPSIDGISLSAMGFILMGLTGDFDRPGLKSGKYTSYGKEGFKLTKTNARELKLTLGLESQDYASFQGTVQMLFALLAAPEARSLVVDGKTREVFAKDGFSFTHLYRQGSGYAGILEIPLIEIRTLGEANIFSDGLGNILTDGTGKPLSEILKLQ